MQAQVLPDDWCAGEVQVHLSLLAVVEEEDCHCPSVTELEA